MSNAKTAETTAQRNGRLVEENKRLRRDLARFMRPAYHHGGKIAELKIPLPHDYIAYLSWAALTHNKTVEDYLADFIKESVLSEIDAMQPDDFAASFGGTLQKDYIEKGPSASNFSQVKEG